MDEAEDGVTRDAFYGGRLILQQPAKGHRSGTDAVLLAAAVQRDFSGLCYDVGSGVGVAGLGVALACPAARVRLVENDPTALRLAEANIASATLGARASVAACDLFDAKARREALPDLADLIVTNPPFYTPDRVRSPPDPARRAARVMAPGTTLSDWIAACLGLLTPTGTLIVIHAATALPDILAAMDRRLGAVKILAVHPRVDASASRVLVRGVKGSRAPLGIVPSIVLHEGDSFTEAAARLHRGEAVVLW